MPESAQILNIVFLALIALYVCLQAAQLIVEVRSVESNINRVPHPFAGVVTLAEHRKAIDYSAEILQCDVVNALIGCSIALVLTMGGVINVLWASIGTLLGQGLVSQFLIVTLLTLTLALIDLPMAWWKHFHINERYGYERSLSSDWFQLFFRQTLVGWGVQLPLILITLCLLTLSEYSWWILANIVTIGGILWKVWIEPNFVIGSSARIKSLSDKTLERRLQLLLREHGFASAQIVSLPQPKNRRHEHAVLVRRGRLSRLVIYESTFERLTPDEILAIAACAIGRVNRSHTLARIIFFTVLSSLFWWSLDFIAGKPFFYEALGIHPSLAIISGAPVPGLLLALCITLIPILLYPAVLFVHAFTRMLIFDEDAYAVHYVGAEPLVRALVKLHNDYRNTLTPHRFYSLCNYRRPHIIQRIKAAYEVARINRSNVLRTTQQTINDRSALYNQILKDRRQLAIARHKERIRQYDEFVLEYEELQKRTQ